ncbi:type VII secretion protein EccE [Stackebrandtia soli]|uniref:type VII secretion protein EccE n=1 Tax=Stackebrandtia soli TaxID=1892856 RepID=UPI0039E9A710
MTTTSPPQSTHPRARLGPFHLAQVLFCELVIAVLLFIESPLPWTWIGGGAVLVLLATFGFSRNNWWYKHAWNWTRLSNRRWNDNGDADTPTIELGPRLQLNDVTERNISLGIAFDGTGWFTGLAVDNDDAPHEAFSTFTELLNQSGVPISSVQLVTRATPMRHTTVGDVSLPYVMRRDSWLLLRLDVRGANPIAVDRGGGSTGIFRAFIGVVGRLTKGANRQGIRMQPMNSAQLNDALRQSLGSDALHSGLEPGSITEQWRSWGLGEQHHVTFALTGKVPGDDDLQKLWTAMRSLSCESQTISIALRKASKNPAEKRLYMRCIIRLSADKESIEDTSRKLVETARSHRVRLRRLNGVHGPATYASATTGGAW